MTINREEDGSMPNNTLALRKSWVENGTRYTQDYVTGEITSTPIVEVDLSIPGFMYVRELQVEKEKALSKDPEHRARIERIITAELKRRRKQRFMEDPVNSIIDSIKSAMAKFYGG